jgi:hypothetical protein
MCWCTKYLMNQVDYMPSGLCRGEGGDISSREREVAQDLLAAAATAAGIDSSSYRGDSTAHPLTGLPTD